MSAPPPLMASGVVTCFEEFGITHVLGIPDNSSAALFDLLAGHPTIRLVTVSREGEAFAVASGIWVGGGAPLVLIQNTGLLESGDALRGTAMRMGVPLPVFITGRGYAKMAGAGLEEANDWCRSDLMRPEVDSAALHTEPTLRAWSVPYMTVSSARDANRVAETITRARSEESPVALILTCPVA